MMSVNAAAIELTYLGWSGFRLTWSGGSQLLLDPPNAGALLPDRECWIFLSHGHPEHVAGTIEHLGSDMRTAPTTVVASAVVCRHLERRFGRAGDRFLSCHANQTISLPNLSVDAFGWRHMQLIPPGVRPAMQHLRRVASNPRLAWQIVRKTLRGPRAGPMLGYRLRFEGGPRLLWYSEGLHRLTNIEEVRRSAGNLPSDALLFAIEPEDLHVVNKLLLAIGCNLIVPYEAHRQWREAFGMPVVDLLKLADELQQHRFPTRPLSAGDTLTLV